MPRTGADVLRLGTGRGMGRPPLPPALRSPPNCIFSNFWLVASDAGVVDASVVVKTAGKAGAWAWVAPVVAGAAAAGLLFGTGGFWLPCSSAARALSELLDGCTYVARNSVPEPMCQKHQSQSYV